MVDPAVRLQALSLQRIAHLFRFKNDAASFSISTLHLPFHTRTFTSHCDILRHDFPLSFRWKSDLSAFFSSPSVIAEPPLHPDCILSEKLAFNRFILRTRTSLLVSCQPSVSLFIVLLVPCLFVMVLIGV